MRFALLGAAGYVAPRHMRAIRDVGGELVAACDPHDSVGILDTYAPGCRFFRHSEQFFLHLERERVDAVVVCTPNDLHVAHACRGMHVAPLVVCEKPLALDTGGLDLMAETEAATGSRLGAVLQMRLHPEARRLANHPRPKLVQITYMTGRGPWYDVSWKGDARRSGGLVMNIGVHLFDLVTWAWGTPTAVRSVYASDRVSVGGATFATTTVEWYLSTDADHVDRSVVLDDGTAFDFSAGFEDLHTKAYEEILRGRGPGIADARPSIELVQRIRGDSLRRAA